MKYCTNCGAALEDSTASFCAECGKPLSSESEDSVKNPVENKKAKHKETKKKKPKKEKIRKQKKTKKKDEVLEEIVGEPVDDGYDGYYDDVIPPDTDRVKEGLDKELIKKIVALSIGVVFIISICVVMLYVL